MSTERNVLHQKEQFIGGYISPQAADRLALVAALRGMTRSQIIREGIQSYLEEVETNWELIKAIAAKVFSSWSDQKHIPFSKYKKQVEEGLGRKKVPKRLSLLIMQEVNTLHDEAQTK